MIEVLKQIQQCLKDKMYAHAEMYLHEAIADLESQEPVAWNRGVPPVRPQQKEGETFIVSYEDTNPPQRTWVGLTAKEVNDLYDSDYSAFHQRIEAKLKQKNGYIKEKK